MQSALPAEGKRLVYDVLREMCEDLGAVKTMLDAYAMHKSGREHIEAVEDIAFRRLRQRPSSRQPMGRKVVPAAHGRMPTASEFSDEHAARNFIDSDGNSHGSD